MKKKVLFSSIMTIVLCLSLIAGSTFALFTSTYNVGIAVTAGKVDVVAGIAITKLESVKADANGSIVDENGGKYSYETVSPTFTNGGTAVVENGVLTLDKITPGDKVTFEILGTNNSNVAVQYRYLVECIEGEMLMSGLVVNDGTTDYPSLSTYTSPWFTLESGKNVADREPVIFSIELPVKAGNEYQEKKTSIKVTLEAVQGNAVVEDNKKPVVTYIEKVDTVEAAQNALADPDNDYVLFTDDVAGAITVGDISNKIIDANDNQVSLVFKGNLENVVVKNITADTAGRSINANAAIGTITVLDSELYSAAGTGGSAIGQGPNVDVVIDNCTIRGTGKSYGLYYSGASGGLYITNTTFENLGSWAITTNSTINGNVLIDNCIFNTPDGVFKTLAGGVTGDFTFTNNKMIGCKGHDGNINKLVVSGTTTGPVVCGGTKTVFGNTLDGVEWTQQ